MNLPDTLAENIAARFAQLDRLEHSIGSIAERLGKLEQKVAAGGQPAAQTGAESGEGIARIEAELQRMGKQLEEYAAVIESSRTAAAQTDELLERVVEALESLQSATLELPEGPAAGVN